MCFIPSLYILYNITYYKQHRPKLLTQEQQTDEEQNTVLNEV